MAAKTKEVKTQYNRQKGAEWFPFIHKSEIMVLGQGGIGSWLTLLLARAGATLHTFDMDYFEDHNMTGQIVRAKDVGSKKTEAVKSVVVELSPDSEITCYDEYNNDSPSNDVVVCGFDNMAARKLAFTKWKEHVLSLDESSRKKCFFQDGRLLAEQLQVINIPGDKTDLFEKYEKEYLFEDSEVEEVDCTFKQTSHSAAMIASHMVGFITNWYTNVNSEMPVRQVPFFYEYLIPLNYVG